MGALSYSPLPGPWHPLTLLPHQNGKTTYSLENPIRTEKDIESGDRILISRKSEN
jgi:hypothetical protein